MSVCAYKSVSPEAMQDMDENGLWFLLRVHVTKTRSSSLFITCGKKKYICSHLEDTKDTFLTRIQKSLFAIPPLL